MRPDHFKLLNRGSRDREFKSFTDTHEGVHDDCNEEVEENLSCDYLEDQVEYQGGCIASTTSWSLPVCGVSTLCNDLIVAFIFEALVQDVSLLRRLKHDLIPVLSGRTPQQSHEGLEEVLKVGVGVELCILSRLLV